MTFNKQSGCVKVWVTLIVGGTYTYEQVPKLLNLQEEVKEVLVGLGVMEDTNINTTDVTTNTETTEITSQTTAS